MVQGMKNTMYEEILREFYAVLGRLKGGIVTL